MAPARGRDLPRSPANGAGTEQLLAKPPGPGEGRPRDSPLGTRGLATTSLWGPLCQAAPLQPALSVPPPDTVSDPSPGVPEAAAGAGPEEEDPGGERGRPHAATSVLLAPGGAPHGPLLPSQANRCRPGVPPVRAPRGSLSKRGGGPSSVSKHRPLDPFSVRDSVAPVFPRLAPPIWASSRLWAPCSLGPSFLAPRFPR